jgi:hypothetical protein
VVRFGTDGENLLWTLLRTQDAQLDHLPCHVMILDDCNHIRKGRIGELVLPTSTIVEGTHGYGHNGASVVLQFGGVSWGPT